jgi:hypothetical protein
MDLFKRLFSIGQLLDINIRLPVNCAIAAFLTAANIGSLHGLTLSGYPLNGTQWLRTAHGSG